MSTRETSIPADVLDAYGCAIKDTVIAPLGKGRINDTFLLTSPTNRLVVQRINDSVFPDPQQIAENFQRVTEHITTTARAKGVTFVCPQLIGTVEGEPAYRAVDGSWWRTQSYVEHIAAHAIEFNSQHWQQLGRVVGTFHKLTEELDSKALSDPLPGFHITPNYLRDYEKALGENNHFDSQKFEMCHDFVERFRGCANALEDAKRNGELPLRVMHGDPKLDNVIFQGTGEAVGLFDLDTVGPGLLHYDIGDCLRSLCCSVSEGALDTDAVNFEISRCAQFIEGYKGIYGTELEQHSELAYYAVLVITFELGLRFLTDHIRGDLYFKVGSRGENLQRALVQFKLAESIEAQKRQILAVLTS